ncbi:hypothetical protein BDF21DRAFT_419091 [Thamnidium elegans]|uniref:C2H2-type domain-containing protein n=1 Tax=Thamnidium elegans TaxID=101142 RepID=A0A8H7SXZ2_9FUNG|nr:hypothetical protein INT48_003266 [Thamnidium elegans]KAI8080474.1 hypothetical protein BDF21DRAFT_419091 [Thamnidium elegans]
MNNKGDNKPSLPSIKDLLEGGPGLLDYSPKSRVHSHRRHASEHILSSTVIYNKSVSCLPLQMQSLSLDKPVRTRTHSRSFSDLTQPYPRQLSPSPPPVSPPPIQDDDEEEEPSSGGKYVCPYCDKGFTRPSSLRTHTYSHTGEKPFQCTEPACGRKFSVQSNLRRHLRIHRLNKPSTQFKSKNIK